MKSLIKKIIRFAKSPQVEHVYSAYSQAGEDMILKFLFDSVGIKLPSYLEIGVYKPDFGSNTYIFYRRGSRGVCVEADETLIPAIKKLRSEDKVLNVGVGVQGNTKADFYIFDEPSLNTFDKEEAQFREKQGTYKIVRVNKVELKDINTIISENFGTYPELLSIDVEGLDLQVLQTLNYSKFPIPAICVETCAYSENHIKPKNEEITAFLLNNGYFVYGDTYINTIFVNHNWFYSRGKSL